MRKPAAGTHTAGVQPEPTVPGVRARIAAGDLAAAGELYRALLRRAGPIADVLLTGAMLEEAEGRLDAALAGLEKIVAAAPRSAHGRALSARVLFRLGRADEAEASALEALRLDAVNLIGLTVLAEVYAKAGRIGERLDILSRAALCAGTSSVGVWSAIDELSAAERWEDVLQALDRRGDLLAAQRVSLVRADALLALGRHRQAVATLLEALAQDHAPATGLTDRFLARRALTSAALFVEAAIQRGHPVGPAREAVIAEARRSAAMTSLDSAPPAYADAVRALEILCPEAAWAAEATTRAALFLIDRGADDLARGDFAAAADHLIQAGRLRPEDLGVLRSLAEAAAAAGRPDRHLDTLLRIHRLAPTEATLMAAAEAARASGRWDVLGGLMARTPPIRSLREVTGAGMPILAELRERLEALARDGDGEAGLTMVAALIPWIAPRAWPSGALSHLLAAAKRRMRGPRISVDPTALGRIAAAFLAVDPSDADVGRLAARLHLRFRRFGEAAELLAGILESDPHVARDWIDLASACHELGQGARRDACVGRAFIIAPTAVLPAPLDAVRTRMIEASP